MHICLQASGMNMVGKAGSTSVLLGDGLRRPLAELELGGVKAGLSSLLKAVTQVLCPAYAYTHTQRGSSAPRLSLSCGLSQDELSCFAWLCPAHLYAAALLWMVLVHLLDRWSVGMIQILGECPEGTLYACSARLWCVPA